MLNGYRLNLFKMLIIILGWWVWICVLVHKFIGIYNIYSISLYYSKFIMWSRFQFQTVVNSQIQAIQAIEL